MSHESAARCGALDIVVIGATGRVGRRLLQLIATRSQRTWPAQPRLRIVAVANSRAALAAPAGLPAANAASALETALVGVPLSELMPRVAPHAVIDCSASAEVVALYPTWLAAGIDVITPNKHGPSADRELEHAIAEAQATSGAVLRDSATVGAQLPLLGTLRELRAAGDRIERFEAVLSGTLSFVLGHVQNGTSLSRAVREAVAAGYAEPHPGRDLSGEDAARKLVILLRALGHDVALADIQRVPLIDAQLLEESEPTKLLDYLPDADAEWRARAAIAQARRERWIYRACFDGSRARVAPERVPLEHALAQLAPCENALILHSACYRAAPLRIAGPGAGIDLTAAAVFNDLLASASRHVLRPHVVDPPLAPEAHYNARLPIRRSAACPSSA
jgi:homoserine dehydrogenase